MNEKKLDKLERADRYQQLRHNRRMRRMERKKQNRVETGKVFISLYGVACIVWITLCIMLDRQEQLAVTIAGTTVIALLGYFAQARFGKYHEEKNKMAGSGQESEEGDDEN